MWLIAEYQPVGLFSLKSALATSSGGRSLLVPTPFAIKMALLDVAYRLYGKAHVETVWPTLRDLRLAIAPPSQIVVNHLFTKVLKPRRGSSDAGSTDAGPLQKSIAFRDYVWPVGNWQLGLELPDNAALSTLKELLPQVNYLGKRGSFIQLLELSTQETLPDTFVVLNPTEGQTAFHSQGVLQVLDDCGPKMTLEHANIYSRKRLRIGKERILHYIVLPHRPVRSSRNYTLYARSPE